MRVDFHVHTSVSDGRFAPEGVLALARRAGIESLAITDHDAIEGFDRAAARLAEETAGSAAPLRLVAGVEFSTSLDGTEVHVLGYFPAGFPAPLRDFLARAERARMARIEEGVRNLNRVGVRLTVDDVARQSPGRAIGRSHLARALIATGVACTTADAFRRFLSTERGLVPAPANAAGDVVARIREHGGVAALAHPPLDRVDAILRALVPLGMDGIEVYGKRRRGVDQLYLETLAREYGLLKTAGSDWHGHGKLPDLAGVDIAKDHIRPFLERIGHGEASRASRT